MLTSEQVIDRVSDGDRPSVNEIAAHFRDTLFWNWLTSVEHGLDEQSRIDCECPLSVRECDPDEDGTVERSLIFESGECTIDVGVIYEFQSEETACAADAHFVANLPVYMPQMFRAIYDPRRENIALRNELATANTKLQLVRQAVR